MILQIHDRSLSWLGTDTCHKCLSQLMCNEPNMLVEQKLFTLPKHLSSSRILVSFVLFDHKYCMWWLGLGFIDYCLSFCLSSLDNLFCPLRFTTFYGMNPSSLAEMIVACYHFILLRHKMYKIHGFKIIAFSLENWYYSSYCYLNNMSLIL